MKWRERRQLSRTLERRVLAGERKLDILTETAAQGQDLRVPAKLLARIPSAANRESARLLNWLLVAALVLAALSKVVAVLILTNQSSPYAYFVVTLLCVNIGLIRPVVRFHGDGYSGTILLGFIPLMTTYYVVVHRLDPVMISVNVIFSAATIVLAAILVHKLLPATNWASMTPKVDVSGNVVFED